MTKIFISEELQKAINEVAEKMNSLTIKLNEPLKNISKSLESLNSGFTDNVNIQRGSYTLGILPNSYQSPAYDCLEFEPKPIEIEVV